MSYQDIIVERQENWIEIQINRPEKLNSLRETTASEIMEAMAAAEHDRDIRAVILKGTEKAFCTGIDTSEFTIGDNEYFDFYRMRRRSRKVNRLFREMPEYTKPVITVIEGFALGGGLELALVGDIIIAGEKAKLGLPEIRLGLMPGGGGTQTLPRLIGKSLAKELMWTGRRLSAQEAKEIRLLNHVTAAGEALDKAREIARTIAGNAPLSVMLTKGVIDRGIDMSLADGFAAEGDASFMLYFTGDRQEGLSAFREKREPQFKGE
ncbi:enoyl-CoA hydratase/isomerase family protein [Pseudochrobactrum asaccharolyticum]|uniref:Short chain enoyl-CoA hydratase n=1 Tax=Pseudochrobactrum asaccharolyticum TaxID=354351 RepID=A0A366DLP2_9HYPH|nr:enoyl-CoA hydratase-related protein [Pseudochrobactrum asaccharolyticum]MBX8802365.1 enoyl-CoA hydratase/isomerase family protein [Ochrobactrum sp. MR28]MBX8817883.1 enoyl-CoA hydratase/isomerase family protein [Ochrobactrum sp. MR31]RBO90409.1 short chain enoyl-CoA hydratase [Pseudochrobactrum asaccharolyticum]